MLQGIGIEEDESSFNFEKDKDYEPNYCRICDSFLFETETCHNCGLVSGIPIFEPEPYSWNYDKKQNCGFEVLRKRFYLPLTHFKDHLRRYLGSRFTEIPEFLLDICKKEVNVKGKNSYAKIRKIIKREKLGKYYPDIFCIIYKCGGITPNVSSEIMRNCVKNFESLMWKFAEIRENIKRKSMPSNYMVLDRLLRKNGHIPFYEIPKLKSPVLRKRADLLISALIQEVFNE